MEEKETVSEFLLGTILPIVGGAGCGVVTYAATHSKLIAFLLALPGAIAVQWLFCLALGVAARLFNSRK